eukprot:gb/GEZN01002236.1/.p1 GENE.gb/GEZN01002236.1/~~gb/GEZN01002236.1/.p1  ORF type:complete len:802 (+),score=48.22 gb/GEZN01002236.1/:150-2408(+)
MGSFGHLAQASSGMQQLGSGLGERGVLCLEEQRWQDMRKSSSVATLSSSGSFSSSTSSSSFGGFPDLSCSKPEDLFTFGVSSSHSISADKTSNFGQAFDCGPFNAGLGVSSNSLNFGNSFEGTMVLGKAHNIISEKSSEDFAFGSGGGSAGSNFNTSSNISLKNNAPAEFSFAGTAIGSDIFGFGSTSNNGQSSVFSTGSDGMHLRSAETSACFSSAGAELFPIKHEFFSLSDSNKDCTTFSFAPASSGAGISFGSPDSNLMGNLSNNLVSKTNSSKSCATNIEGFSFEPASNVLGAESNSVSTANSYNSSTNSLGEESGFFSFGSQNFSADAFSSGFNLDSTGPAGLASASGPGFGASTVGDLSGNTTSGNSTFIGVSAVLSGGASTAISAVPSTSHIQESGLSLGPVGQPSGVTQVGEQTLEYDPYGLVILQRQTAGTTFVQYPNPIPQVDINCFRLPRSVATRRRRQNGPTGAPTVSYPPSAPPPEELQTLRRFGGPCNSSWESSLNDVPLSLRRALEQALKEETQALNTPHVIFSQSKTIPWLRGENGHKDKENNKAMFESVKPSSDGRPMSTLNMDQPTPLQFERPPLTFQKLSLTIRPYCELPAEHSTTPAWFDLVRMTQDQLSRVEGFAIKHERFGCVLWPGKVDVRALLQDPLALRIKFSKGCVDVYPEEGVSKPTEGQELNQPAQISLKGCWGSMSSTKKHSISGPLVDKYTKKLKDCTRAMGATFIDYEPADGIWKFSVVSF